ncbi:MAG: patatin-like phospholipase family protein, partial [Acidobacteria bacterium]|nr:patatin-like phospholipase family protein [Acidobacteriota bacterium]
MTTPGRVAIALAWALAWGLAVPASAVVFARAGCPDQVATALTLALPLEDADLAPGELHSRLEAALEQAAPAPAGAVDDPCVGQRKVQVNVAFGSSYQVLDWLSRRQVDGGVVTPFGLSLLARDEVEVVPLVWKRTGAPVSLAGSGEISRPWSGPVRSTLRAGIWRAGRLEPLAGAAELWREYREEVWCRAVREISGAELEAQRTRCSDRPPSGRRLRPVMPSHLSSGGFVAPVGGLGRWLDARLAAWQAELGDGGTGTSSEAVLRVQGEVRGAFWRGFFEDLRLTLDHQPVDRLAADSRDARRPLDLVPVGGGSEEIELLVSERSAADASEEPLPWDDSVGSPADLLVLLPSVHTAGAAEPQRIVQRLPVGFPSLPEQDEVLLYRRQAPAERPEIVASWASAAEPERYFGTRTFDFTADEALRLLRLHRRVVPEQRLALVLPGGGVKAAYQSVLLDELYGSGALRNRRAEGSSATTDPPLAVDEVVGTSGGSLIGYFVAQLDSPGRPLLSQVLWQRSDDELLSSLDIFGWLDQLRWLSFIVAFGGLCLVLALASLHRRGRGARESGAVANRSASDPAGDGVAAGEEGRAGPSWRPA